MDSEKNKYKKERYKGRLQTGKEAYTKRKEYLANFKLQSKDSVLKGVSPSDISKNNSSTTGSAVQDTGFSAPAKDPKGLFKLGLTKLKAPYVFGAAGPNSFDCSGFVTWLYNQCGYKFARNTAAGFWNQFEPVANPEAGDLVFFSGTYKPGVSHIGIVMGDGNMLHTASEKRGVEISSISSPYWKKHFTGYRRVQSFYYKGNTESVSARSFSNTDGMVMGDTPSNPPEEESLPKITHVHQYIPVKTKGVYLLKNTMSRQDFLTSRVWWGRRTNYKDFVSLDKQRFIHQDTYDGYEGNLYSPDAKSIFENLLFKTKKPYFEIISGFRFSLEGQLSPHEAGCAIDIFVKDIDEAREIADCAWSLGITSIAIGGEFEKNKGFVHVDIAPKGEDWGYEGVPIYGGPGKWAIG